MIRSILLAAVLLIFSATMSRAAIPSIYLQSTYKSDVDETRTKEALKDMERHLFKQFGFHLSCATFMTASDIGKILGEEGAHAIQGQSPSKGLFDLLAGAKGTSNMITLELVQKANKYIITANYYSAASPSKSLARDYAEIPLNRSAKEIGYAMEGLAQRFAHAVEKTGLTCPEGLAGTVKIQNHDTGDLNGMTIKNNVVINCNIAGEVATCHVDVHSEWKGNGYDMVTQADETVTSDFKYSIGSGQINFEIGMITVNETETTNGVVHQKTEQFGEWYGIGPTTANSKVQAGRYKDRIWTVDWNLSQ